MFKILYKWSSGTSVLWFEIMLKWLKSTAWTLLCAPYYQSSALSEFMAALDLVTVPACFSIYPFYARVMDCDSHNSFTQTHSPHQTELEHWGTRASRLMGPWLASRSYEQNMDSTPLKLRTQRHLDLYLGCPPFYPVRSGLNIDICCCCIQYLLILHFRSPLRLPFRCNWAFQRPVMQSVPAYSIWAVQQCPCAALFKFQRDCLYIL